MPFVLVLVTAPGRCNSLLLQYGSVVSLGCLAEGAEAAGNRRPGGSPGGGHLAQRWSSERRFDNPSVYCESWKRIFAHIWERIAPTLTVEVASAPEHR